MLMTLLIFFNDPFVQCLSQFLIVFALYNGSLSATNEARSDYMTEKLKHILLWQSKLRLQGCNQTP